jgi:hypothetical protein
LAAIVGEGKDSDCGGGPELRRAHRQHDYLINEAGNLAKGPPTVPALNSAIAQAQPSCWQLQLRRLLYPIELLILCEL